MYVPDNRKTCKEASFNGSWGKNFRTKKLCSTADDVSTTERRAEVFGTEARPLLRCRFGTTGNDFLCPRRVEVHFGNKFQLLQAFVYITTKIVNILKLNIWIAIGKGKNSSLQTSLKIVLVHGGMVLTLSETIASTSRTRQSITGVRFVLHHQALVNMMQAAPRRKNRWRTWWMTHSIS